MANNVIGFDAIVALGGSPVALKGQFEEIAAKRMGRPE
jgi:hypothetical protein